MFIGTRYQVIKDYEDCIVEEGMIEILDEMLTEYGVEHFFTLPDGDENGIALDDSHVVNVYYDDTKDSMTFSLVFLLWSKTVRKMRDERMEKGIVKWSAKWAEGRA